MKKILVMVMAVAAISFAACTGETKGGEEATDSLATIEVAEASAQEDVQALTEGVEAQDADALKITLETMRVKIQKLIEAGDVAAAQKYLDVIKAFVEQNKVQIETVSPEVAQSAETTVADLVTKLVALPGNVAEHAEGAATEVVEAGKAKVEETKAAVVDAANEQVEAGKAKVAEQVEAGKSKANQAIEEHQKKANDAIDKAANDLKNNLGL